VKRKEFCLLDRSVGGNHGTFGNQTFGISSHTAGCTGEGVIASAERLNMYAGSNFDKLQRDIALGNGESLATLAHLMGIQDGDKPAFYSMAKSHFADIFPSEDVTAGQMLAAFADDINNIADCDPDAARELSNALQAVLRDLRATREIRETPERLGLPDLLDPQASRELRERTTKLPSTMRSPRAPSASRQ
jgi:hypothetical protein